MRLSNWKPILILSLGLSLVSIFATEAQAAPPSITSLSPTSGAVGALVTITGSNFGSTQGTSTVKFNGATATATSWSASSIVATVPSGATTGNVVVTVSNKASNGVSFTVVAAPSITSLLPASGAVGASVTISGSNFGSTQGSSTVKFNGTTATVSTWSVSSIVATVPSGATTGNVVVHASGVDSNGVNFTVVPAPSITSLSPTAGPVGTSVTISGSNFGSTQGSSTVTFNGTTATPTSWSDTSIVAPVPSGASTGLVVVTVGGIASNGVSFTVNTLPTGWADVDVGAVGLAGSVSYASNAFTVQGAGCGFNNCFNGGSVTADAFHFVYQPLSGDGTIVARVVSTSSIFYTQAGVMIRETLGAGSTTALTLNVDRSMYFYDRLNTGSSSSSQIFTQYPYLPGISTALPYWVKVVRSGSIFSGYISSDGMNWLQVGPSATISMAQNVYIGLAMSSESTGTSYTGTFDNVSVSTTANSSPMITSVSATTGSIGNQVVVSGLNFGASQGNSVVLLNGVAVTINSWGATSITLTIPTGATSGPLVVSVVPSMNDSNAVEFTVTSTPLPSLWLDQDIGEVGVAGSAGYANGVFTVKGAGCGVYINCGGGGAPAPDGLHFVYQPLSGDGTIVARVVGRSSQSSQVGLMIRETMDATAKSVFVAGYSSSAYAYYRILSGGTASYAGGQASGNPPYWVKLVRIGNGVDVYQSPDAASWTPIEGTIETNMAQNVYIGLGVSGSSLSVLSTATFDNVSVSSTTTPAPVITGLSTTTGPIGSQVVISGSGFGASQGGSTVLLNDAPVTINSWNATSINITIPTGATSGLMAVLVGPSLDSSNTVAFTVTSQPLPSGWLDMDIGAVGLAGNASYANGVFTVQAAGNNMSDVADAFHFVYQTMSTSGTIIARVASSSSYGALAGVMIRETLGASATNVASFTVNYTSSIATYMKYRTYPAITMQQTYGTSGSLPYWVKVVRDANQFSAYACGDGSTWVQIGTTQTITTAQTVYVGFGVSSENPSTLTTATFDNVSVTPGGSLANPQTTGVSPTTGAPGATVTISGSGFGATQGSNPVSTASFNGATAAISTWSDTQIVATVPDGATTGPVMVTVGNITSQGPMFTVAFHAQITDSLGNQTSFVSSLQGGQWAMTSAQGSGCSTCTIRGTIQKDYDGHGNVQDTTDAMGNTTLYEYDSSNNLTSKTVQLNATTTATTTYTYNSFGEVQNMTDPLGFVTSNTYDSHGNLLTLTTPAPASGVAASVTTFTYDTNGELLTIKDPLNNVTTLTYFPTGLINTITDQQNNVTTYVYDAHGNRTSVTDALNHQTTFAYDAMDRLTTITYPDTTTTTFGYDYRGRRTSVTDQNGKITTYAYDDADRLTTVTDAATPGNVTTYGYDTENNLTSIQDANHNTTSFTYDTFRRVTKTTFPSGNIETYGYDANNNLTSKTDRKNQQITYTYDLANRLTGKTYPDSTSVAYTFDNDSRLTQVTDPTGTYKFTFDNMGRLTQTTTTYSFLTRNLTTGYSYDKASNRTGFTDPESGSTTYAYDTLNRLQTLTPPAAFATGNFGFSYDALSRRTQMTRPNSVSTLYAYDNLSRLQSVLHQLSGSTIDGATYTVDNAGNRTVRTPQPSGTASNYAYDAIYELTNVTQGTNTTESYTYDPVGNRLSSLGVSPYTVNTSNELTSTPSTTYTYDSNGNTLTSVTGSNTTTYAWDFENRLTSVTLPGSGGTVSFKYDPFGRRIYKSSSAGTSIYAYDLDNLIEETNSSGTAVARYTQSGLIDEPLAMLRGGATSYYDADGLGSVTSLSSAAGSLAQTYTYDSFGNVTATAGSLTNPFRYTGRDFDTETNLQFSRARYYDPQAGRFLSEDPMRFKAGINFYRYVKNNAANLADPFGLKVQKCCRNTQVNAFVDFFSQLLGLQHCYIKTDTVTAGMGPANNGPLPACPIFSKTAITDHSAEPISPGDCKDVPGVDEACVNNALKPGTPTGRWTPTNQCNSLVGNILDKCSTCPKRGALDGPLPPGWAIAFH